MEQIDLLVAFASALLGAVAGSWTTVWFGTRRERAEASDRVLFDIYLRLCELNAFYFWITTADFHREARRDSVVQRVETLARSIADDLRRVRDHKVVVEIFDVLASKDSEKYPDAKARYAQLDRLLADLGRRLNPEYIAAAKSVGQRQFQAFTEEMLGCRARLESQNAPLYLSD